tara:strand:+ start:4771 stop:5211 length:441 start_codon:yes stop_codon:yes gene_type:complete
MASKQIHLREWDDNPYPTNTFRIVTKMTNLGDDMSSKSILGFFINYFTDTYLVDESSNFSSGCHVSVGYRSDTNTPFQALTSFSTENTGSPKGNIYKEVLLAKQYEDIVNIQLEIKAVVTGSFAINDFGLLFRVYNKISSTKLDED